MEIIVHDGVPFVPFSQKDLELFKGQGSRGISLLVNQLVDGALSLAGNDNDSGKAKAIALKSLQVLGERVPSSVWTQVLDQVVKRFPLQNHSQEIYGANLRRARRAKMLLLIAVGIFTGFIVMGTTVGYFLAQQFREFVSGADLGFLAGSLGTAGGGVAGSIYILSSVWSCCDSNAGRPYADVYDGVLRLMFGVGFILCVSLVVSVITLCLLSWWLQNPSSQLSSQIVPIFGALVSFSVIVGAGSVDFSARTAGVVLELCRWYKPGDLNGSMDLAVLIE